MKSSENLYLNNIFCKGDKTLWVQNILNRSSGDLSVFKKAAPNLPNVQLQVADAYSLQSIRCVLKTLSYFKTVMVSILARGN